jgi:hypothetical protein
MDHPNTRALYSYWDELRAGRDAPGRSEIDPRRISGALETMFILEALDDGQLRFRLAGTRLCEWLGMEARGCVVETVMAPGHEHEIAELGRRVLLEPGAGVMRLRAGDGAGTDWAGEALLLPMRSELGEMARIIGCVNLDGADRRRRPEPPLRLRCQGVRVLPIEVDPGEAALRARAPADPLGARSMPEASGFGEGAARFQHGGPVDMRPRLTAIEGNPEAARKREDGSRPKPNLRLVED